MRRSTLWMTFGCAVGLGLSACGDSAESTGTGSGAGASVGGADTVTGGQSAGGNSAGGDNGAGGNCFGCSGGGTPGPLTVVPATATLAIVDGVSQPIDFNALSGSESVPAEWVVDLSSVANTDSNGLVSATGALGGEVLLRATYGGETATALITVTLTQTLNPGGLTPEEIATLETPTGGPDASIVWAYPYDKTVFPKGVLAPEFMWNNGAAGDKYFIHLKTPFTEFNIFTTAEPPARHQLDQNVWTTLTESGLGGNVELQVNRLPAGAPAATTVIDHDWTIASGPLRGAVYYWANNLGRVLRVRPGAGEPEDFLADAGQTGCSTCHSVSANGSTLVIGGDINVSTFDLLTNTPVFTTTSVGKPVRNWAMPAVSPDGTTLIENNAALPGPPGGSDGLWDTATGAKLTGLGLDGEFLDMPAFAPDGSKIVYVDHDTLNLSSFDWDPVTKIASNPQQLVERGDDPALRTIAFPTVSPNAKWTAYHRGNASSLDTRFGPGSLYLASTENPGVEVRLANINGDNYPFAAGARDLGNNYEPTFAPLEAGGYAWVVFTSRRTYGNRLVAGAGSTKQIWVAAIDANPADGVDPSHPAFRIPGQSLATLNMRGYWALEPCKQVGASCETGSECCNQNCDAGICTDPDPEECADAGDGCEVAEDCCDASADCVNGFCTDQIPE